MVVEERHDTAGTIVRKSSFEKLQKIGMFSPNRDVIMKREGH